MPTDIIDNFSVKRIGILDSDGKIDSSLLPPLTPDDLRTMYWWMNLSRTLNTKMLNLQKQGKLGTFASTIGQEGAQIALVYAAKDIKNAWYCPSFRETPALLLRGVPMESILRYWGGFESGSNIDKSLNVLPVCIPIGTQLNHAVGLGMSMNIKNEKGIVFAFVGDGGTSEGETSEAMNFAGVFKAPIVFFCQNNHYAISTSRDKQTASKTLAQKAIAFGFEGVQVDGNDVFAVYKVAKEAIENTLNGNGPILIEAETYRMDNHTTADDWKKYRSPEEVEVWSKKDPILRLKNYMISQGIWDDTKESHMLEDAQKKVDQAVQQYESTPKTKVEEIFDHVYATIPQHLAEQKEAYKKFWSEQ